MQIRKVTKAVFSLSLAFLMLSAPVASAIDSYYSEDGAPQGKLGLVWVEDSLRNGNPVSYAQYYNSDEVRVCKSLTEKKCLENNWNQNVMLVPCSVDDSSACIEGISIGTDPKNLTKAKLVRNIDGNNMEPYLPFGIPRGGTIGIWEAPGQMHTGDNNQYSVAARIEYGGDKNGAAIIGFQASVVPIRIQNGSYTKMELIEITDASRGGKTFPVFAHHIGNCAWQEADKCAIAQQWQENAIASLKIRVPKEITGWLYGRIASPSIDVSNFNKTLNTVTITAKPVTVQGSKPLVDIDKIPTGMKNFLTNDGKNPFPDGPNSANGGWVWQIATDNDDSLNWYKNWFAYTNDKADGMVDYWNIKSIPSQSVGSSCISSTKELVGLVTSNSMLYSGSAPVFRDQSMQYKVTSLHYMPDGVTPFLGSYNLVMRSSAARCLYKFSSAPVQAVVEVINPNGSIQVATTILNESDGWLKLSAAGFTFSSPTLKIKLTQNGNRKTLSKQEGNKITITCIKGKVTQKVSAVNPKCPSSYKKMG